MHELRKRALDGNLGGGVPFLHHPTSADHDVANRSVAAREHQVIQCVLEGGADHGGVLRLEHQPIGAVPHAYLAGALAQCLCTMQGGVAP